MELERPVHALFLSSGSETLASPRVVIGLREQSRASVVEQYAALDGGAYLTNAVTDVSLDRGASLEHVKLQNESTDAFHIAALAADQEAGSELNSYSICEHGANGTNYTIIVKIANLGISCQVVFSCAE